MIRSSSKWISTFIILLLQSAQPLLSENRFGNDAPRAGLKPGYDDQQCSLLVQECLHSSAAQRTACLYYTSQHLFCSGGELGALAKRRSQLGHTPGIGNDGSVPALIDRACLEKFDNHLSARLIRGSLNSESIRALSNSLDQCVRESVPELLQP